MSGDSAGAAAWSAFPRAVAASLFSVFNPFSSPLLPRPIRRLHAALYRALLHPGELLVGVCLGIGFSGTATVAAVWSRQRWQRRLRESAERRRVQKPIEVRTGEVVDGVTGLIGNTPLLRIGSLSALTGCEVLGKCEFLNPGGSVKDRVTLRIIRSAQEKGLVKPHTTPRSKVFEGTSGSTGVSLAMVAKAMGYDAEIILPDDTTKEKVELMEKMGATVVKVRPVSIVDPKHYVNLARRRAMEFGRTTVPTSSPPATRRPSLHSAAPPISRFSTLGSECSGADDIVVRTAETKEELFHQTTLQPDHEARALFADQFETKSNFLAHYEGTGPEIWAQAHGDVDAFVSGAGTGGTIAGVGHFLKSQRPDVKVVLADPPGSGLYHKVKDGVMFAPTEAEGKRRRHQVDTVVEGIGLNRATANFNRALEVIDDAYRVTDAEAVAMSRFLVQQDGLFLGSSSAVNLVACVRLAKALGRGKTIVCILCDSGNRHMSKFWNDEYLAAAGIPVSQSIASILES